MSRGKSMISAL